MIADAAVLSSFGERGVIVLDEGVEGSLGSRGRRRRERSAWRGGRRSNVCGGGRVEGVVFEGMRAVGAGDVAIGILLGPQTGNRCPFKSDEAGSRPRHGPI